MVANWVKELTEEVLGGPPVAIGKNYEHPEDGPITIVGGRYWGDRGLSNHWTWDVIATGERKGGYGSAWPEINITGE